MNVSKATMKKKNITLDLSFSNSSSHGHVLYASSFSFDETSTSFNKWLIDSRASYHIAKDKAIFYVL